MISRVRDDRGDGFEYGFPDDFQLKGDVALDEIRSSRRSGVVLLLLLPPRTRSSRPLETFRIHESGADPPRDRPPRARGRIRASLPGSTLRPEASTPRAPRPRARRKPLRSRLIAFRSLAEFVRIGLAIGVSIGAVAGCDRPPAPPVDATPPPATAQSVDREGAARDVARAQRLFAAGDFPAARTAAEEAIAQDPDSAPAHYWLGRAAVVTSKATSYSLAITAFERALALDPKMVEAHFGLGLAHMGYAHGEEARRELTAFLAGATDEQPPQMRGEAEHMLGVLARERGANDEALERFARAEQLHPKFAEPAFERGVTLEGVERIDEAIAAYRAAIALDPGHLPSHFRLARLLRRLGRDAEAAKEERIHRLLNELTDDQTGRTTRAPEKRAQLWGELALLDPNHVHARIEYVRALVELERPAEAKLALEELLRARPELTAEELPPPLRAMMPKR